MLICRYKGPFCRWKNKLSRFISKLLSAEFNVSIQMWILLRNYLMNVMYWLLMHVTLSLHWRYVWVTFANFHRVAARDYFLWSVPSHPSPPPTAGSHSVNTMSPLLRFTFLCIWNELNMLNLAPSFSARWTGSAGIISSPHPCVNGPWAHWCRTHSSSQPSSFPHCLGGTLIIVLHKDTAN